MDARNPYRCRCCGDILWIQAGQSPAVRCPTCGATDGQTRATGGDVQDHAQEYEPNRRLAYIKALESRVYRLVEEVRRLDADREPTERYLHDLEQELLILRGERDALAR